MNTTTNKTGIDLLHDPSLNKSTAFTEAERAELGLIGLVPDATESEDLQLRRVLLQLSHKTSDIDRYVYLANLLDHDETLFYRTLMSDPARFLPIVYDPTIGEACLKFGHLFRARGPCRHGSGASGGLPPIVRRARVGRGLGRGFHPVGTNGLSTNQAPTSAQAVTSQNCQSSTGNGIRSPPVGRRSHPRSTRANSSSPAAGGPTASHRLRAR